MGRLGHALAATDDDTNASFRTESQCFLHRARNCSEWPDKLLRVASITASARLEELVPASYKREEAEAGPRVRSAACELHGGRARVFPMSFCGWSLTLEANRSDKGALQ
jgi:hypothetical protein